MDEWLVSHKWQKAPALISIAKITPHLIQLILVLQKKVHDKNYSFASLYQDNIHDGIEFFHKQVNIKHAQTDTKVSKHN